MIRERDFHQDNFYSLASSAEPFWAAVYRKAFHNLVSCETCTDLTKQRQGIDRILRLSNGHTLQIDEKKRAMEYTDILLEYTSNLERNTPGWIEKDLTIDYLAYGFMQSRRCYLFPWAMLQRAWKRYGESWKLRYRPVVAKTKVGNATYQTISVAVPIVILQKAVTTASVIDVSQEAMIPLTPDAFRGTIESDRCSG